MTINSNHLYQLCFHLLLEIRMLSHEGKCKDIFKLTDFLHNLPLSLARLSRGETTAELLLKELEERAKLFGAERWLQGQLGQITGELSD